MARADVEARRSEVEEDLRRYSAFRGPLIEEIDKRVKELGSFDAASESDRFANARHATNAEGVFLEGTNNADDKAPINFLERGVRAARAVCHIVDVSGVSLGTGFVVAPGLLLTNNHVLPTADGAEGATAIFKYELDADEIPARQDRFSIQPTRLFATSPQTQLDFTFVAIGEIGIAGEPLATHGWLPLDDRPNKILEGQPVVIIQHPNGQMKAICLFDSVLVLRDKSPDHPFILYTTDTDFGSSGSPAFNRFWQVIGLHHASIATGEARNGKPVILNRGIRISSIFSTLKAGPVNGVLAGSKAAIDAIYAVLMDPRTRGNGRPFSTGTPSAAPSPIVISERTRRTGTVIRRKRPDHFANRAGFDPMFLTDIPGADPQTKHPLHVALPKLPDWLKDDAARLVGSKTKYELKYQHFSIVMSASRSLAIFTACNIDGGRMFRLAREDRDPDSFLDPNVQPEAAADVWSYDPRLSEHHQLGPQVYDATSFEYGHLVRRLDPVWGDDPRIPRIANDDTFCMTNCSPQEGRFHRTRQDDDGNWSALEDVILNEANLKNKKFVVLTGPILDPRDPTILGVKIPRAFWKIAAYEEGGALKAHGFLLWQESEVSEIDERFESTVNLKKAGRPVKIREIARLSGLDFGSLFDADIRA